MVCQLSPQGLESATLWSRFSPAAPLRTGVRGSSLASAGAPAGPNPGPSILPDPGPPDFGPRAAPCLQGPKSQSFLRFFAPSGAKSWGSGGAPPTNLILLRNQLAIGRARARRRRNRPSPTRGPNPAPPGPTRPPGPVVGGCWWLVVGLGMVVINWRGFLEGGAGPPVQSAPQAREVSPPSSQATTAASLRSFAPDHHRRRRSYRVPSLDDIG